MQNTVPKFLVIASIVLSILPVWLIGTLWFAQEREFPEDVQVIASKEALEEFIAAETIAATSSNFEGGAPVRVPTGVFIQSLVFSSSTNVNLTGYIWQKYPKDYPYQKGVIFPEQISSDETFLQEEYTDEVLYRGELHDLVGWYFDVTVRQSFDYSAYPLDFLTIRLRVWPSDFENDEEILLVPDFDSYIEAGADTFGLDSDLVQGEWRIDRSFFSYRPVRYDTTFGYEPQLSGDTYNELFFNLGAQRKFINAFVINLVPLLVVGMLLFAGIMTLTRDEKQSGRFGSSTSGLIGTCSALFFVVMLSHIQVRGMFAGSGLVYLEYFYLVMYGVILATALNGYLFSLNWLKDNFILRYKDNFIAKVTFWPLMLWGMLLITVLVL